MKEICYDNQATLYIKCFMKDLNILRLVVISSGRNFFLKKLSQNLLVPTSKVQLADIFTKSLSGQWTENICSNLGTFCLYWGEVLKLQNKLELIKCLVNITHVLAN